MNTSHATHHSTSISPADDGFHFAEMGDRWWATETSWFAFHNAERKLGGWIYLMVRPNIGTVAGGAWVWDSSAHLPWEVLYSANYTSLRLDPPKDLRDATFATGVSIKVLEPLSRYKLGYVDGERLRIDLEFQAVMPPMSLHSGESAFGGLGHFDQAGRIVGHLMLHGERIEIDSFSMRDRSWGPRPEHRPKRGTYVTGMADARNGFLAMSSPHEPGEPVKHGFLLRDGVAAPLVSGSRQATYGGAHGYMQQIVVRGTDSMGRSFEAVGEAENRIVLNRHTFIDVNSLVQWTLDGQPAWGEDQDLWPVHEWAQTRRGA